MHQSLAFILVLILLVTSSQISPTVQFIAPLAMQGASPIYNENEKAFYFLSGKLTFEEYLHGLQKIWYDSVYDT